MTPAICRFLACIQLPPFPFFSAIIRNPRPFVNPAREFVSKSFIKGKKEQEHAASPIRDALPIK